MNKRNVATLLWFLMGWSLALVLAAFAGFPSFLAPVLAAGLAVLVRWDPTGRLWSGSSPSRALRDPGGRPKTATVAPERPVTHGHPAKKRDLATVLWFLAGWSGGGLLAGLMGLPAILAFVPGILLAVFVRWDPTGIFWSRSVTWGPVARPINEFAE